MKKMVVALVVMMMAWMPMRSQNTEGDRAFELSKNLEIFSRLYQTLYVNYVDDIDPGATMKKAIDAMLSSLDPYTVYYPESDMEDVKLQLMGQYGGIGALIHQEGKIYIHIRAIQRPSRRQGRAEGRRPNTGRERRIDRRQEQRRRELGHARPSRHHGNPEVGARRQDI